jgi:hypothetical protein
MQPIDPKQQQAPQPNYNFIINPASIRPKSPLLKLKSMSKPMMIVAGLIVILLIVIAMSLFGGRSGSSALVTVTQRQQALINIANVASAQTTASNSTQASAVTIKATVGSAQNMIISYSRVHKLSVNVSVKKQNINVNTSSALAAASSAGTFDSTYKTLINNDLTAYSNELKLAYAESKDTTLKTMLNDDYASTQLLIKQISN